MIQEFTLIEIYEDVRSIKNFKPKTEVFNGMIECFNEYFFGNILKGFSGEFEDYGNDLDLIQNLRDDKMEALLDAIVRMQFRMRADRYIDGFLPADYIYSSSWDTIMFTEEPFKMLVLHSDIEPVEYYFTADSVIVSENGKTRTSLYL